jgi:PAS domain S-box-containing protein
MITLDMKTVMSANVVVNFVGMVVMFILWYQNRNKYSGISLWVLDWVLLTGGALLITQQGAIPNWESMVVSNSMIIGGTLILYFGLRRFAGQKDNPLLISAVSVLFALYVAVHTYYTYVHSDLLSRSINSSAGLFLACLLACWLMFKEVSPQIRRISKGTGFAFAVIAVICLIRIIGFNLMPDSSNLFLQSGKFDAAMVLMLVGATAFLVFNLVLMVNNRLFIETEEMENILKRNVIELRAVFQTTSVGFGILTNRVFREVNDASCEMLGYSRDDIIGKDTRMFYPTVDEYNAVGQMYQILPQLGLVTVEMRLLHKDGRIINVIMSISAFDKNNLSQGVVLSLVDITRRKQLEEKSNYLASFPELNPNPVLEMDTEGNLKYQNPATRSIFPGLGTIGMDHPFLADWRMIIKELQDAGWSGTVVREIKVGNEYYEQVISPVTKNEIRIYSRNITSRTLMAARINNLNSILQLTTNINQLIVKIDDETILLQKACDQFVESRQYLLSWIGLKKDGSFDILPSARAGKGADYLSSAKITWDDSPLGQGPTGICIKTGKLYVVRDILHDPNYEPWREQALKMGFVSSVALPLVMQEKIIGVLNIYSANAESFDAKELDLLAELAGDLSLGIEKIRQRQERLRMDEALKASEEKYSTLIEQSIDGILILEKRLVVFANHRMSEMSGFPQDEILGKYFHQLAAPEYQKMLDDEYQRRQAGEEVSGNHELDMLAKDGRKIAVETKVQRIIFQGKPAAMVTIRDITERKQAEMLANTRMVLLEYAVTHTLEELLRKTLDEVGVFVDSPIGFYHFVQSDQKTLSLQAWSTRTENEFCKADGKGKHGTVRFRLTTHL